MPDPPTIRAVVFDMDDTLYPERDYVRGGYRSIARELERMFPGRSFSPPVDDWLWRRFLTGRADRAFDALSEHFDLDLSAEAIAELVGVYRTHRPDIQLHDGAKILLERLGRRYRLGLLSDGFLPAQQLKLDALGIEQFFTAVVFTEKLGRDCWKPSPVGFETVARRLDADHAQCAYVGDNPAKDFVAPNALGWLTIQYVRPGQIHSEKSAPDGGRALVIVRSDEELLRILLAHNPGA